MFALLSNLLLAQEAAPPDDIYDIVVLEPKESPWGFLIWLVLGLLLLIAIALGIFLWIRERSGKTAVPSPEKTVARRFQELAASRGEMEPNHFSLAVSDALKDYLEARFAERVRYETTQEFLSRAATKDSPLPSEAQEGLTQFLTTAEEIKFGNLSDAGERAEPLLTMAGRVVSLCQGAPAQSAPAEDVFS